MSGEIGVVLQRARAWLDRNGSQGQRLLAAALLGERDAEEVEGAFAARQDAGGAIAEPEDPAADPVLATARALDWLHAVGRADGPVAERAAAFLAGQQTADGSWGPEAGEAESLRIERTAGVAAVLARIRCVRGSVLARAADYLAERWSADRLAAGGEAAVAAWFPALSQLPDAAGDEALQWCGRELEKGVRSGRFDPLRTAGLFVACHAHALPGARLRAEEAVAALLDRQAADGSWPGGAGATLDALRALRFLAPAPATAERSSASC